MHPLNPNRRVSKQLLFLSLAATTSLVLTACGSDDAEPTATNPDSTAPAPTPGPGPAPTPAPAPSPSPAPTPSPSPTPTPSPSPAPGDAQIPGVTANTAIGEVLAFGSNNRTLYTFANDDNGVSNCNGGCAVTWPPILAQSEQTVGDFSTLVREDGSLQWSFKGDPLYYYVGDASEGEVNGEGIGDAWYVARSDPWTTRDTGIGTVFTGRRSVNAGQSDPAQRQPYDGRTLYVFANDTANTSNCEGGCATTWPPLYADAGATSHGDFTVMTRSDGTSQWALRGNPMYFYSGDGAPGDTTGEGVGGVWFAANPSTEPAASTQAAPGATTVTSIGEVLVFGARNRTLYTFANDDPGLSNCNGGCAQTWPPIVADTEQTIGQFSTIARQDGTLQWAFKNRPLYYYINDVDEGQISGDGVGGVWYAARPDPVATGQTLIGEVLTAVGTTNAGQGDPTQRLNYAGRSLYVFANDSASTSNCNGGCAGNWPPLYADAGAVSDGDLTVLEREDGTHQWAYQTRPLYFYAGDSVPGDTNGDGVNGVWSAARP